jgi:hypothetical protein
VWLYWQVVSAGNERSTVVAKKLKKKKNVGLGQYLEGLVLLANTDLLIPGTNSSMFPLPL